MKEIEDKKSINPLIELKHYIKYADYICLLLIILCFIYIFLETYDNHKFNYFKIINIIIEIAIFILYLIRFLKFIKVKEYFFNNKNNETKEIGTEDLLFSKRKF